MELYEKNGNILYILNVLKKYSDEDHILSSKDICDKIKDIYKVSIDSRTVRRNIALLVEKFNYDISIWNENKKGYYLIKDPKIDFESGEIRAIIDVFSYSNFIPDTLSKQIVNKCKSMQTVYENEKIKDYEIIMNDTKVGNLEIIKNIEDINNAIYKCKKISFDYWKYELISSLEKVIVNQPTVSPYRVVYSLQNFYLICLTDGKDKLYTYRVDRMRNINILDCESPNKFDKKEVDFYIKNNVAMFSGNATFMEVKCHIDLLDNVVELFGKNIKLKRINDKYFSVKLYTNMQGFKYWILRNIEKVEVINPKSLKKEINKILKENIK